MKTFLPFCLVFVFTLLVGKADAKNVSLAAAPSTDATLKSIVLSTATNLVFSTGPSDYNYTTSVSPGTATLTIEPTTNDPNAVVTVNGVVVASGASSAPITLNGIVTTTINMLVTAQDGVTTLSYSIVVYETGSNNAFLSALSLSTGNALVISPTGPGDYNYTTSVDPSITSLTVTPTTADPTATVTYNGTPVTSGSPTPSIPLNATGTTTITVVGHAQDGVTTLNYCIIVSKTGSNTATLSSLAVSTGTNLIASTGSSNFNYTTAVKSTVSSLTVTPTATDPTATIKVNGVTVASGGASGSISLNAAPATTTINIIVTAQDGTTTQSYSITVSRNATSVATLSSIVLSTNSLLISSTGSSNVNYTTSVSAGTSSMTVTPTATDPNSTITVNGVVVASGTASGAITLNATGTTTINILCKSQDATTTISTAIVVSTNGSNNANTYSIVLNPNSTLVNSTGPSNVNYTTSVSNSTTSITVTPTPLDPNATVTVNGVAVTAAGGYTSASIPLNATGTTLINVLVTAEDGVTIKSFGITVSKGGSNNASVSSIVLSTTSPALNPAGNLVNSTGAYTTNYTTSIPSTATVLTVTTTAVDANATISVNGGSSSIGTSAVPVTLNTSGTTLIVIVITSQDGTTTKSVGITVSRKGSNNATISSLSLSTNTTLTASGANYTSIVSAHTTTLTVTVTTQDGNAKVAINGFTAKSGNPSDPITLNATGTTTINVLVTAQDGVTTKSLNITISKSGTIIAWTGASNIQWNNSANWSPAKVPGAGDVATLGVNAYTGANQPTLSISTGTTTTVAEIIFGSNNSPVLTINPQTPSSSIFAVGTSLTVNTGSTATIKSSSASTTYVNISPTATVNVSGTGQLIISSPIKFTLKSLAAGSASVGQISSNSIVGTVYVERFITGGSGYRGYRLLTSSVNSGTGSGTYAGTNIFSLNYVSASCYVTGTTATAGGFDNTVYANPSLYLYRENLAPSNASFTSGNFRGINNITVTSPQTYSIDNDGSGFSLPVGTGFQFFFRGNRVASTFANETSSGYVPTNTILTESGTLNQGQITVKNWFTGASTLLYTTATANSAVRGFNLVGNPYASSVDWDLYNNSTPNSGIYAPLVGGNPTVSTTIYVLDPVSKNYGVYMANSPYGGTNNATHIIASGQGFFVTALDPTASLTFNEDAKLATQVTGPNLLLGKPKQNAVSQYLHVKLFQDTIQADEIFIAFNDNARSQYVFNEDAPQKPGNGIASLSSMSSDGVPLSINTLKLQQSETIRLNIGANLDGAYQIALPEVKSIPALYNIWLMDAYKKDSIDVRQNPTYSFTVVRSDTASYGANRFSIVMRENPALGLQLLDFTAAKQLTGAQVTWKTQNEENYTNFTVERSTDGGVTFNTLGGFVSNSLGSYSYLDTNPLLTTNRYRLKLEDYNGTISYSNVVTLIYGNSVNSVAGNINVYPNPASSTISLAIVPFNSSSILQSGSIQAFGSTGNTVLYDIKIVSMTGTIVKTATSSAASWHDSVSNLLPGTYIIQVVNSRDKSVVGKSTFIKL